MPAGVVTDHVSYFGDFFETAAELAGAETSAGLDSISLLPEHCGRPDEQADHDLLYGECQEGKGAEATQRLIKE